MTAKQMLAVVLQRAKLTERERESLEDMWDRINRYNRCSDAQRAWIERIYFGQKLNLEDASPVRRRVVPTWQKSEPPPPMQRPVATALPPVAATQPPRAETAPSTPMGALTGPGIVKTNARQIMLRRQGNQSGTFRISTPKDSARRDVRIGYINYPGLQREERVTSLGALEAICPRIVPGSKQYQRIATFFACGGVVLKVKPLEARVA